LLPPSSTSFYRLWLTLLTISPSSLVDPLHLPPPPPGVVDSLVRTPSASSYMTRSSPKVPRSSRGTKSCTSLSDTTAHQSKMPCSAVARRWPSPVRASVQRPHHCSHHPPLFLLSLTDPMAVTGNAPLARAPPHALSRRRARPVGCWTAWAIWARPPHVSRPDPSWHAQSSVAGLV
jgi:hypothetical protein